MSDYQLIIIGGGPAGLTAGIYATRARLNVLLLEKIVPGGQITNSEWVENYPGFPEGISGFDLGELMKEQAVRHGLEIDMAEVTGLEVSGSQKVVKTAGNNYTADAVIIAGGAEYARLGVPGEEELLGKGLSFCATCDGAFFRDRKVAVVGGGNLAITDALFLTRFTSKVYVIHRRDQLRADRILQERAFASDKIEIIWDTVVDAIDGKESVSGLKLRNVKTQEERTLEVGGVFMAVGTRPNTGYLAGTIKLGQGGTIPVNDQMETRVPGIFAAGDIREGSIRQVVAAAGDGAIAAMAAEKYIG
ncbi:MAG: thioredoxin-disulfide reductase [Dehalococcoidia bacterium]